MEDRAVAGAPAKLGDAVEAPIRSEGQGGDRERRGIDREAAQASVGHAECGESQRLAKAVEKIFAARPQISYPGAARALGRLGFPASLIYRQLRERASALGDALG